MAVQKRTPEPRPVSLPGEASSIIEIDSGTQLQDRAARRAPNQLVLRAPD